MSATEELDCILARLLAFIPLNRVNRLNRLPYPKDTYSRATHRL
jgi:hypothetical protein